MNILIFKFPYSSQYGGGEKHTLILTEKLQQRGHQIYLASFCPVLLKEFTKRKWLHKKIWAGWEPVSKWSVFPFLLLYPLLSLEFLAILIYYRFFKKTDILYCLSLTEKLVATPVARILGMKVVWVEHTLIGKWLQLNPWRIVYLLWSNLAEVVAVSYAVHRDLRKLRVNNKKITVIYNGIDVEKCPFVPALKNYREFFNVGTICRLHREKGVEYLLKAIKIAKEFVPSLRLVVIGDGPERQKLIWLSKQLEVYNNVMFIGFQKEVSNWIKDFDIFVLPSISKEAFGLVSLEAMACGKPIIATRVGGIPEVIDDGQSGILVEPVNAEAIAQNIIKLHRHPKLRRDMGIAGRKRVEERFTEKEMISNYENLFYKLLNAKK